MQIPNLTCPEHGGKVLLQLRADPEHSADFDPDARGLVLVPSCYRRYSGRGIVLARSPYMSFRNKRGGEVLRPTELSKGDEVIVPPGRGQYLDGPDGVEVLAIPEVELLGVVE